MQRVPESELRHYGTKRHSGRYPWGSGETPYQHEAWFVAEIENQKANGVLTDKELADYFGMSIREYRKQRSLAKSAVRNDLRERALEMSRKGLSNSEIARRLGKNESTVRSLLKASENQREARVAAAKKILDGYVSKGLYLDIGEGVAQGLGMPETQLELAVQALKNEKGYKEIVLYIPQVNDKNQTTTVKVLCPPGTTRKDVLNAKENIAAINERFVDTTGTNIYGLKPIKSISSDKIKVNYAEDGGKDKDGVIEIRRGAEGLDLGNANYAQVRIGVDGTHYLKGMAVYADDLPDGIDIIFNTNKHVGTPKSDVFKKMGDDPDNPFGTQIKPGGQKGYLNIVSEEGDWNEWSRNIASQMLSKQPAALAKTQLNLARAEKDREFEEIQSLDNPTLRRYLLNQFADQCDTASVNLKAAAMPRQASKVLLPLTTLRDNEVYAPSFRDGETLVLIRYPHGGRFEIPEVVNHISNEEGRRVLGNSAIDAIGVNSKIAAQLSGADFDGDTVVVIPNNRHSIKTSPAIKDLIEFEPKELYKATADTPIIFEKVKGPDGKERRVKTGKTISPDKKQNEMGVASNLITDMTIKGAPIEHIVRAVKYSMVVIDSEKHNLDYKKAAKDFDIASLQKLYQDRGVDEKTGKHHYGGASTLISQAKSVRHIPKVKRAYKPNPETGAVNYIPHERQFWTDNYGKRHAYTTKMPAMRTVSDANELSSGQPIERIYADYANYMKALGNKARKTALNTKDIMFSSSAAKKYADEVTRIKAAIREAKAHAPLERKAQILANIEVELKQKELGDITKKQAKKIKSQALAKARQSLGGGRPKIDITPGTWEAVQAGAFRKTTLEDMFRYSDQDTLKKLAMPREEHGFSAGQLALIKARLAAGYTQAEVADMLGVSPSTISRAIR